MYDSRFAQRFVSARPKQCLWEALGNSYREKSAKRRAVFYHVVVAEWVRCIRRKSVQQFNTVTVWPAKLFFRAMHKMRALPTALTTKAIDFEQKK